MRVANINRSFLHWLAVIAVTLACISFESEWKWLSEYPDTFIFPFSDWFNVVMNWIIDNFGSFFMGISWLLEWPIWAVQKVLNWLPWSVSIFLICVVAYSASGGRLAAFALAATLYMVVIGYWEESMNSLSLVAISVPLAILVGFAIGVWGFYSNRAERVIMPSLDLFQTVPAFAYLLPILLLFGFGTVVGLIASVLYSFPPMVRNTIVGLRSVAPEVIESGLMSGATPGQLFWQVRVRSCRKQMLLGVNQATMASLSMVIIASIIGGTSDIGWEVLTTIRKAQFGESLLVGMVIALMAMIIDRITFGLAQRSGVYDPKGKDLFQRYILWLVAVIGTVIIFVLAQIFSVLMDWPRDIVWSPGKTMNDGLNYIIVNYHAQIDAFKTFAFFYLMLPIKIGLQGAVSPFTWGFSLTPTHNTIYALVTACFSLWFGLRGKTMAGVLVMLFAVFVYFGLTNIPWPCVILIYGVIGWKVGGRNLGIGTMLGFGFMAVTGNWSEAMLAIYLCGIAAIIAFIFGTSVGIGRHITTAFLPLCGP